MFKEETSLQRNQGNNILHNFLKNKRHKTEETRVKLT